MAKVISRRTKAKPAVRLGVAAFLSTLFLTTAPAGAQVHFLVAVGHGGYPSFDPQVVDTGGRMFGGLVGIQASDHVALEGTVDRMNYRRNDWTGWKGSATAALGRVAYMFGAPARPARFFLGGLAGYMEDELQYPSSPSGTGPLRGQRKKAAVFGGASGVEISLPSRLLVRPEFGVLLGYTNTYVRGTIGFGLGF